MPNPFPDNPNAPDHYELGPSSAFRWLKCPGSVNAVPENFDPVDATNPAAERGTLGHAIVEYRLTGKGEYTKIPFAVQLSEIDDYNREQLEYGVEECVSFVEDLKKGGYAVYLETKIASMVIPDRHGGTVDVIAVKGEILHVVDFKFGNIPVDVDDNKQIQSYLNLARPYFPECTTFRGTIIQPSQGGADTVDFSAEELDEHLLDVVVASASTEFNAGDHCRFCPLLTHKNGACPTHEKYLYDRLKEFDESATTVIGNAGEVTEPLIDQLERMYRLSKLAATITENAGSILKQWAKKGKTLNSYAIRPVNRMGWKSGVEEELLKRPDVNRDVLFEPEKVTTPAKLRTALGMKPKEFSEEFKDFIDWQQVDMLVAGKGGKRLFPEFD